MSAKQHAGEHTPHDMAEIFRNCARMIAALKTFGDAARVCAAEFEKMADEIESEKAK